MPEEGATLPVTVTGVPCAKLAGNCSLVCVAASEALLHRFARLVAFTEPRPVARSYPVFATGPGSWPFTPDCCEEQPGELPAQGTPMLPAITS